MSTDTEQCPWCGTQITRAKFQEIEEKIRHDERKKFDEYQSTLQKSFATEKQIFEENLKTEANKNYLKLDVEYKKLQQQLIQSEASKKELYEKALQEAEKKNAENHSLEMDKLKRILEIDFEKQMDKQKEENQKNQETLQKKIADLDSQLKKTTAQEPEVTTLDLFEELQNFFPSDRVTHLHSGELNEKILIEIVYKEQVCGSIIIDPKCRKTPNKNFLTNLHNEQLELTADYAILATTVFPKNRKSMCVIDDVILSHPESVSYLILVLRKQMISMHIQGLSSEDRNTKKDRLYEFISSPSFTQNLHEAVSLTEKLGELDVEETKQHSKVWEKRGILTKQLQNVLVNIDTYTAAILEEPSVAKSSVIR